MQVLDALCADHLLAALIAKKIDPDLEERGPHNLYQRR
jgi:hypothetical protein